MAECWGRNPGPSHGLPTLTGYEKHDYTKNRAPAYSLGLRLKEIDGRAKVGPYNVGPVDRFGRYPYMGWTIESPGSVLSNRSKTAKTEGPSPLSYAPEKMKLYTPAYSFGMNFYKGKPPVGPSPADYYYRYPPISGFTIGHPYKDLSKKFNCGPKAAVPLEVYKSRAPAYSLGLKGKSIFNSGIGPGPKYLPKDVCVCQGYSFGMKHHRCSPPLIVYEDNN